MNIITSPREHPSLYNHHWRSRWYAPEVGPGPRTLALMIVPVAILAYYIIFSYTLYIVGLGILAALGFALTPQTGFSLRAIMPLLLWYAWCLFTLLWSPYDDAAFFAEVAGVFVCYGLLGGAFKVRLGELFPLKLVMYCCLAYVVCALYSFFEVGDVLDPEKGSMRSLFAAVYVAALPACVYLGFRHRSPVAAITLILSLGIGLSLGSRTYLLLALPAMVAAGMVVARGSQFLRMVRYPLFFLMGLAAAVIVLEATAFSGGDEFEVMGRETSFEIDETIFWEASSPAAAEAAADLERRLLVVVGFASFSENPMMGAGYMSTPFYMRQYYRTEVTAHGFPLFLLGELGLIGTILFLILIGVSVRGYFRDARGLTYDQATVAYVELVTLLVIFANGMFHQVYSDMYFYLFLGIGLWRFAQSTSESQVRITSGSAVTQVALHTG